jgi:hydroxymethylpyrimidine pyrophosphatase-like HAD family hydrolase
MSSMRYRAFVTDYDGTLAHDGGVTATAIEALEALRKSDCFLIMVTGRLLQDLQAAFPSVELFDAIVAENGAVTYDPARKERTVLAQAPPPELHARLQALGVPLEGAGDVILATREPHEAAVLEAIRELGLEMQLIFNKGAVMVLPSGVNKASGLMAALDALKLSPHNAVGVGDAENDHAFLALCECSAATANALDSIKAHADVVLEAPNGAGVTALAQGIVRDDLAHVELAHRRVPFAQSTGGREIRFDAYLKGTLLFAGASGGGKSSAALAFLEQLAERGYQICIVDPEGDYESFGGAVVLGDATTVPTLDEVADVMDRPERSVIVNLLAVPLHDRPGFIDALLPRLFALRAQYGRPHWIVLDEAHHLFPRERRAEPVLPRDVFGILAIAADPAQVTATLLDTVTAVVAVGANAAKTVETATGKKLRECPAVRESQALFWQSHAPHAAQLVVPREPQSKKQRHRRKYAQGDLAPDKSFFFRGPDERLNLRANNLTIFAQIAEGIDDETWRHHLQRGDYATWFHEAIGDDELAEAAQRASREPQKSRELVLAAIRDKYTRPA